MNRRDDVGNALVGAVWVVIFMSGLGTLYLVARAVLWAIAAVFA